MTAHRPPKDLLPQWRRSAAHAFTPLQRELNRFLDELGDGWDTFTEFHITPRMDAVETKAGLEITLELPGLRREDVRLTVDGDVLTVTGDKKAEQETHDPSYRVLERDYGEFRRSIHLPRTVDPQRVSATMVDGVLKIVAPRRAGAESKIIPIQSV